MHRLLSAVLVGLTAVATVLFGTVLAPVASAAEPATVTYAEKPRFSWVPNGPVYTLAKHGDIVYIGGAFTSLRNPSTGATVPRARLAALHADTGHPLSWNPGADATVRALAAGPDGVVYAGGDFSQAAGTAAVRIAAITPTGAAKTGWSAKTNGTVRQIRVDGSSLYVAGNLTNVNGATRVGVAKIRTDNGSLVFGWNAKVGSGRVRALALDAGGVLLGGSFTTLSGAARPFLGRVSSSSGAVTSWAPVSVCGSCDILDLDVDGTDVYAAVAGGSGGRAAKWSTTDNRRTWITPGDGDVQAVDVIGDTVYIGGHFGPLFDEAERRELAALDASDGDLLPFSPALKGRYFPGTWDLLATEARLYVAGGFQMATSPTARYGAFPVI